MRVGSSKLQRQPWIPLLAVAIAWSVALSLVSNRFLTSFNIYVVLSNAALLSVIGFSQLTVLSVGEFSLAVGGIGELAGVIVGFLLASHGIPLVPAVAAGLLAGAGCGFLNGLLVAKSGVSGFVITLATGGAFSGGALAITHNNAFTKLPAALNVFGYGRLWFVPYIASAALIVAVALSAMYRWRRIGRLLLAVGGNAEGAELSGLSKTEAIIWAHTLSGLLAAVAGTMAMAQLHEANASAAIGWLIQSFTVPIIGGTSLSGGSVSIVGVLVAGLILAAINDGLLLLNVNPYWITLVEGVLVFLAVLLGQAQSWNSFGWVLESLGIRDTDNEVSNR